MPDAKARSSVIGFRSLSDKGALITGLDKPKRAPTVPAKEMLDTGSDCLTDDVECSFLGDLRTAGVSSRAESEYGDGQPRGYP